jgi:hypothetical protein
MMKGRQLEQAVAGLISRTKADMEAINGTGNGRRIGCAFGCALGGPRRRLSAAAVHADRIQRHTQWLRPQFLRRLCAKPTTGRGRFQTVAQAA